MGERRGLAALRVDRLRARALKRLRNLLENPVAAFITDRYDEDWTRLGWIMLRGPAEILAAGGEHDRAQALLRARYPQYRSMELGGLPENGVHAVENSATRRSPAMIPSHRGVHRSRALRSRARPAAAMRSRSHGGRHARAIIAAVDDADRSELVG